MAGWADLFLEEQPFPCFVYIATNNTVHCTDHNTAHCTVHYIVHCSVYYTVHCALALHYTLQRHQKRYWKYTVYWTEQYTVNISQNPSV